MRPMVAIKLTTPTTLRSFVFLTTSGLLLVLFASLVDNQTDKGESKTSYSHNDRPFADDTTPVHCFILHPTVVVWRWDIVSASAHDVWLVVNVVSSIAGSCSKNQSTQQAKER